NWGSRAKRFVLVISSEVIILIIKIVTIWEIFPFITIVGGRVADRYSISRFGARYTSLRFGSLVKH
ncbi:hypothetical protein MNBD_PLANCTO02-1370, partial [hydrothermal vent metagenome]